MVTGNVLVVDDSPHHLAILSDFLQARGHAVQVAKGGEEALTLVKSTPPDLVMLDINMPGLNGFEVCRQLRQQWPAEQMPVVFVSGTQDAENKVKAFEMGAVDYVTKPFNFEEVVARVETHLELKKRAAALELANEQLRSGDESRRRFITSMVHDIKNPLTPVLKNTEWLLTQPLEDPEVVEVVRDTYVAAKHLHRMVLSLLDLARSTEHQLTPHKETVDIPKWLDETLSLIRLQLRSTPERLVSSCQPGKADFDAVLMSRVIQNTIDNALKYSPRSSPVMVAAKIEGERLLITVEDRGSGVKPEDRERIFAAWTRVNENDANARTSHGIGLAFCRQAVEAHGGQMTVEEAQPQGARFVVSIPIL